uniref:Uncharacterized protein n=1 Tax=Timema shepardi TaxID=629360 RepID=A0A7R9B9A9_TIMSH|nr:unnamed protein product [Timema shepardi]
MFRQMNGYMVTFPRSHHLTYCGCPIPTELRVLGSFFGMDEKLSLVKLGFPLSQ